MHTGGCNARARPSGKGPTTPTAPPTTLRCVGATAQEGATARSRTPHHAAAGTAYATGDRKSTRLNSSHSQISYAVFCLKKKKRPALQLAQDDQRTSHSQLLADVIDLFVLADVRKFSRDWSVDERVVLSAVHAPPDIVV